MLAAASPASAQAPETSFDALAGRVQAGQRLWVTDAMGREVHGRLERLGPDGLVLKVSVLETFAATDVLRVRARDRDPLKNGMLVGLAIGGGMGTVWCIGAILDESGNLEPGVECAAGFTIFPGPGLLIGMTVDAIIPGRMRVVYQSPSVSKRPNASLIVAPMVTSRVKGLAVSVAF